MPEVIYAPKKYPIILLVSYIEILPVKDKNIGEFAAVIKSELVVIGKLFQFIRTDIPGMRFRYSVFSG